EGDSHFGHPHRHAGVAGIRGLYGIHGEGTDGVRHVALLFRSQLVGSTCGRSSRWIHEECLEGVGTNAGKPAIIPDRRAFCHGGRTATGLNRLMTAVISIIDPVDSLAETSKCRA